MFPVFILAGFFISTNSAKALTINSDTVWHNGDVIIINDGWEDITVNAGAKLTVEEGVVIKLADHSSISVSGDLEVLGSADNPVVITSIKDNTVGGDTYVGETLPLPGDWGKIETVGANARINIDYAQIKYGGAMMFVPCFAGLNEVATLNGGEIVITHSRLIDNFSLFQLSPYNVLKINYSDIYNNYNQDFCYEWDGKIDCGAEIDNTTDTTFDLTNNYWGSPFGPTVIFTPDDFDKPMFGTMIFGLVDYEPFLAAPWEPEVPEPKLNPVILIPGLLGSWDTGSGYELDPILNTYDNLWAALKQAGYEEDKTLFAMPYDWRRSNNQTAILLKDKIQEVINVCKLDNQDNFNCDKVDLVAHSMGGLVARAYAESDDYADDIDQIIFIATPQRGAPMAYLAWEGGDSAPGLFGYTIKRMLDLGALKNGYLSRFSYIRKFPIQSLQELLPVYNYLKDADGGSLKIYPDGYPTNDFLDNLNSTTSLERLDNINMMNIVGKSYGDTIDYIRVEDAVSGSEKWEDGKPENYGNKKTDQGLEYGNGDGTVPNISNENFYNSAEIFFNDTSHQQIVTDTQNDVIEELTGKRPEEEIRKNIFSTYLMIRIFSPADFVVVAPDGKKLGKDFINNQNLNEIEGSFYSGFESDIEFAVIPDPLDGEYEVLLQGTDNGEYRLSVSGINEATSTDKDFIGQIFLGQEQNFKIDYSSSSPSLLEDLVPQDVTVPDLIINSPQNGDSYKHNEKMNITYKAVDDFSGIETTEIKIDDEIITTTTVDLFDYTIGEHVLFIKVFDRAGNFTEEQANFNIISNIESTLSDIEMIYKLDYLKNIFWKNILIGELKVLDIALKSLDKEKSEILKSIEDIENNPKLSDKIKEKLVSALNKKLDKVEKNRQKAIKLDLNVFDRTLEKIKKFKYLNQDGYDIIKSDLEYLKINL